MSRIAQLHTAVPGPGSRALMARWQVAVPQGVGLVTPVFAARTRGATVEDVDGNRFIDFAGGIGVLNVGANHPEVVAAVQEQAAAALHTCTHVTMNEPYLRLAETLARIAPGSGPRKTLLVNSGAEAVENAVKIARKATGRTAVVAMENAFHGRTLLGMTLTGKASPYRDGFGPFAPEVYRAPYPYVYRSPFADDPDRVAREAAGGLERLIVHEIGPGHVAAVIAEPIQGESGFIVPPASFFPLLREICTRYGIVFIADEIQTGFYRTGPRFCIENWGVDPDLLLTAKSLGGGLPLAAVVGKAELMDAVHPGGLGGTYGGNPVACAAALKVIEIMDRDDYGARARHVGQVVRARFDDFQRRYPIIGDVRGIGAMVAFEMVSDRAARTPFPRSAEVARRCYEQGLIVMKAGLWGNVVRFLAPLTISDDELEEGLGILEQALQAVSQG